MFGFLQLDLPFLRGSTTPEAARSRQRQPEPAADPTKAEDRDQTGDQAKSRSRSRSPANPLAAPPQEPRSIHMGGQELAYIVRRSAKRRTLGLLVDTRGLRVAAPLRARQADIDKLLLTNTRWVLAKLKEWQQPHYQAARAWQPGAPLPLLGVTRPLKVAPGRTSLAKFDDLLLLTVPRPEDEAHIRQKLRDALKDEARSLFLRRVDHFAARYAVPVPTLRLTQAATRWGSCARDRDGQHRVSLNWRMIHFEERLIDYVVAHEIAHIKHMHHGPRFWAAVEKLYPDYLNARDEIRRRAFELPEI